MRALSVINPANGTAFGRRMSGLTVLGLTSIRLDLNALLFTAAVALLTGVVFGLAPALQNSRTGVAGSLRPCGEALHRAKSAGDQRDGAGHGAAGGCGPDDQELRAADGHADRGGPRKRSDGADQPSLFDAGSTARRRSSRNWKRAWRRSRVSNRRGWATASRWPGAAAAPRLCSATGHRFRKEPSRA